MAQLVARLLWEQEVRGSSPRTPTLCGSNSVVEFLPSKQAVAGSSPVSRSSSEAAFLEVLHKLLDGKRAVINRRDGGFLCLTKASVVGNSTIEVIYRQRSRAYQRDYQAEWQVLDVDMSGWLCGKKAASARHRLFC